MDTYKCPHCDSQFRAEGTGKFVCPTCGKEVAVKRTVDVPWDAETKGAAVKAMYDTVKNSLTEPVAFFEAVAKGEGIFKPWLYAVIICMIVFAAAASYQAGFAALQVGTEIADAIKSALLPTTMLSGSLFLLFLFAFAIAGMPVLTTVGLIIEVALLHLGLMILGAAKKDVWATWRTACYSTGPQVIQLIPIIGGMVAGLWVVALNIIGLKVVHETTYARSAIAVFLPLMVCCGLILLVLTTVAGGVFAALMTK